MPDQMHTRGSARYEHEVQSFAKLQSAKHDTSAWSEEVRKFSTSIEEMRQQLADAHSEIERLRAHHVAAQLELNIMRRMFVVLSQLHLADGDYNAMAIVHDVLTNFVGTEEFACVLFGVTAHHVEFSMGVNDARVHTLVGCPGSPFERLMREGRLVSHESRSLDMRDYLVAFPLMKKNAVVGAVIIFQLLTQKNGIERLDRELFDLISRHAAPAFLKHTAAKLKEEQQ